MKILLFNQYAGSPDLGMEFRPYYMARDWVALGHEVAIVTGSFSHVRHVNPSMNIPEVTEHREGITYHWIRVPPYDGNGVKRVQNILTYSASIWIRAHKLAAKYQPDLVVSSSTHPLDYFGAHRVASLSGAVHVHEVHDLWPSTLYEVGGMGRFHPWVQLLQVAENRAYRNVDFVVSMLPDALPYMSAHGLSKDKFAYIPNGVVQSDWKESKPLPPALQTALSAIHERGDLIVGYAGGFNLANELGSLLEAAQTLPSGVHVVLAGDGPCRPSLEDEYGCDRVTFLPAVSKREIPSLLREFDICFVGYRRSPLYRFGVSPNKLFDYMMAAKPIIYSVEASNDPVRDAEAGLTVPPEDTIAVRHAIKQLVEMNVQERTRLGENGRRYVLENNEYSVLSSTFLTLTLSCSSTHPDHVRGHGLEPS